MVNAFRGASDLETRYIMRKAGLSPEDVHFVEAGPDLEMAQLIALRRRDVAAIASSAPYWYIAEQEGFTVLGDVGKYYAQWVPAALVARAEWVDANHDLAVGVRNAFREVAGLLGSQSDAIVSILQSRIPEFRIDGSRVLLDHVRGGWDPAHRDAGLRNYIDAYCAEFDAKKPRLEELMFVG
jgi:ABC-type nitrate/sulfonate/bicarbonate transport system substrate-binding protein